MNKLFSYFQRNKIIEEKTRKIKVNDPQTNALEKYLGNRISTSKYNLITFLPKNLFEQFHRLANAYFLFLLCLQLIPAISSLPPYTTIVPLCFVLSLTAIKDAFDDIGRHRSDNTVNHRETQIIFDNNLITKQWKDIQVGDIIQLSNNQFIPADLVILSSSEANGLCYIETAELDGETNLKVRQSLEEIQEIGDNLDHICDFDGEIECESPNNNLNKFSGNLKWKNKIYPLTNDNILLRGTKLRNTSWMIGVVIYAGLDTKLMKNINKATFKRSHVDQLLDKIILRILIFLLCLCGIMTIGCSIWELEKGFYFRSYLPEENFISNEKQIRSIEISFLVFPSYIITLSTLVPISLYVSIEFVRLLQSKWIDWDVKMYYKENNIRAQVRTTTLNEQLGQIQYIFSDKTGTLTQNIMIFKKCSIKGIVYGNEIDDTNNLRPIELIEQEKDFIWYDQKLLDAIDNNDKNVIDFFTLLSLCHTVMIEEKDGKMKYEAQSPDENALVSAARSFGFAFINRTQSTITIQIKDQKQIFSLLNILDFNNERQRMSVIVEKDNQIYLYCKGGDTKIKERLANSEQDLMKQTDEHIYMFANDSLRTLCLAWKQIDKFEYEQWTEKLNDANSTLENREERVAKIYEEIEQNLILLGATAIEDKLQDGVEDCIERLSQAGIKIWVLTGDKIETAYNIGLSSKLLTNEMEIEIIEENNEENVKNKIEQIRHLMIEKIEELFDINPINRNQRLNWNSFGIDTLHFPKYLKKNNNNNEMNRSVRYSAENVSINDHQSEDNQSFEGFAILITGQALTHALTQNLRMKFLEIATMCQSVICCRVTPLQKAEIVELVMKNEKQITLAIGDGANDVSMIQKAHIGIGISGQEGQQAVLASDFSFGQFRYLERLLLIHGRLSYLRISKFLRYFFYKNFTFTFSHICFAFFCGYSGQSIYDPIYAALYNTLFTTFPILVISIIDRDVNDVYSLNKPYLYRPGQNDEFFNKKILIESIIHGLITSLVIFFVSYVQLLNESLNDLQAFGFLIGSIIIIVVNLENALENWYWTKIYHLSLWLTFIIYFIFHIALYSTWFDDLFGFHYNYVGVGKAVLFNPNFYLLMVLCCAILLLPIFSWEFYRMRFQPNETDKARFNHKYRYEERAAFITHIRTKKHSRRRLPRSSYAFAQQEGWGPLITSGKMKIQPLPFPRSSHDIHMEQQNQLNSSQQLTKTL